MALVVVFAALSREAGKEALADAHLRSADREIARLAGKDARSPQETWLRARQTLADSLSYSPRNPVALEHAGLLELRAMRNRPDAQPPIAYARSAYMDFRAVLAQRPVSAENWANLALAKYYLAQWDPEMFAALRHADELGPWEFHVQQTTLFVRISAWSALDAVQRAETVRNVARAARHNAGEVAQMLGGFKRLDAICAAGGADPALEVLCRSPRQPIAAKKSKARQSMPSRRSP